jgi:hypothetical protein
MDYFKGTGQFHRISGTRRAMLVVWRSHAVQVVSGGCYVLSPTFG